MNAKNKKSAGQPLDLKSTMESIEKLLENLENPDTDLEQSLSDFEKGMKLVRDAQARLAQAEQKINTIVETESKTSSSCYTPNEQDS